MITLSFLFSLIAYLATPLFSISEVEELAPFLRESVEVVEVIGKGVGMVEKGVEAEQKLESGYKVVNKKVLGWGKNSKGHLIKHRNVLGYGHKSAQEAQKLLPQLRNAANKLLNEMKLTRTVKWESFKDAKFYKGKGKMIVTQKDGTFITVINKTSNNWFQEATLIT